MEQQKQHDGSGGDPSEESGDEKPSIIFPEEVVDVIIAKMPFPSVLKARLLSKSWNQKFSCPSEDSPSKGLTLFQRQASSASHKWPSYCPVFVNREDFWGFDRVSSQWKTLFPRVSTQWKAFPPLWKLNIGSILTASYSFSGPLMLVSSSWRTVPSGRQYPTFIVNVITGRSTQLRLERVQKENPPVVTRLLPGDSNSYYRVLQIHRIWNKKLRRHEVQTALYDSKVSCWSRVIISTDLPHFVGHAGHPLDSNVYLRGKLYCLCRGYLGTEMLLCVNNVDSDLKWTATRLPFSHDILQSSILRCGEKIMLVIYTANWEIFIYELGLKRLSSWKQLVKDHVILPNTSRVYTHYIQLASDHDFIYVSENIFQNPVMTCNVHSGEWGTLPLAGDKIPSKGDEKFTTMLGFAFTPGQNPFAIVQQTDAGREFCP